MYIGILKKRAQRGSHIPALRPRYVLYSYMDPLGLCQNEISYSRSDKENTSYLHVAPGPRPSALKHSASTWPKGIWPELQQESLLQPIRDLGFRVIRGQAKQHCFKLAKCKATISMGTCLIELAPSGCDQSTTS